MTRKISYLVLAATAICVASACGKVDPKAAQASADGASWHWSDVEASVLGCNVGNHNDKYDLQLNRTAKRPLVLKIRIMTGDKEVYSWVGHAGTVFAIKGDLLYYADFSPISTGGEIVSVNLSTGKERWRSPLKALGPISHSVYSNHIILDGSYANPDGSGTLSIWGNESMGRYFEIKDAETGETVGSRGF